MHALHLSGEPSALEKRAAFAIGLVRRQRPRHGDGGGGARGGAEGAGGLARIPEGTRAHTRLERRGMRHTAQPCPSKALDGEPLLGGRDRAAGGRDAAPWREEARPPRARLGLRRTRRRAGRSVAGSRRRRFGGLRCQMRRTHRATSTATKP